MPTPMQQQYADLKAKYPDTILLFRLGDFYETFDEDAEIAAKVLGITLTGRGTGENRRPMAGIPYHALNNYLPRLVAAGYKVALASQLTEPKPGVLVEREVTDVITPGAIIDAEISGSSEHNYLACVQINPQRGQYMLGLVFYDIGIASISAVESAFKELADLFQFLTNELQKYRVKELLISEKLLAEYKQELNQHRLGLLAITTLPASDFAIASSGKSLADLFGVNSLKSWGVANDSILINVLSALKIYARETLQKEINLQQLKLRREGDTVNVPWQTYKSLEIFADSQGKTEHSLFALMNLTYTNQGHRLLKQWFLSPTKALSLLEERQQNIADLLEQKNKWDQLKSLFKSQPEYDRLAVKLQLNRAKPWDLRALAEGLTALKAWQSDNLTSQAKIIDHLAKFGNSELFELGQKLVSYISPGRNELTQPGFINPEADPELKELAELSSGGSSFLQQLQAKEARSTGISSLKIRYNKVFGYYIEISKTNLDKVPANYIRRQTLANAERFVTTELTEWEEKIMHNEERRLAKERQIWEELCSMSKRFLPQILELSSLIAEVDTIFSLAQSAAKYNLVRPNFKQQLELAQNRHLVLSDNLREKFIANDAHFNQQQRVVILTGPNMAGKSTYIRSIAITQLLAQIGSFVPASKADLNIVDGIYTRVGAADNLTQNESTFMVEMTELSYILRHATENSLVILDEVGRGTATYDGVAIAWAVVEFLSSRKVNTLFATHYHELTALAEQLPNVKNYHVEVIPGKELTFTHRVLPGSSQKSFGVAVAKLAGIAPVITKRAYEIQRQLEKAHQLGKSDQHKLQTRQMDFADLLATSAPDSSDEKLDPEMVLKLESLEKKVAELKNLDLNTLSPLQLMQIIQSWQQD